MADSTAGDSPLRWFMRGLAAGVMFLSAVNAASYFFRSKHWNSLLGKHPDANELIGFPWVMWEGGNTYGGLYVDYPVLAANALFAIAVGVLIGGVVASFTKPLNRLLIDHQVAGAPKPRRPIQFSLQGMMIATCLAAMVATLATHFAARRETLVAIYLFGPLVLVGIAMLPRKLSWQTRVCIIIPTTLSLIAAAVGVGLNLRIEFDRVLMAIFLCWTPQSALAALLLTTWLVWTSFRHQDESASLPNEPVS